jgi:hypothetical protein
MSTILEETRTLVDQAAAVYDGTPDRERLDALARRLAEPLRVAVAGRVKAGKSTLLNALVADRLAPTDAGECTRIVTWYADSHTARVTAEPVDGPPQQLRFERTDDALRIDLGGRPPESVSRLVVEWPSRGLRTATLIDTPGIGSLSDDVAGRAWDLLAPEDEETAADAVLYLLRHLHGDDVDFLRAFHDTAVSQANPVNAIGVLSRADEVGAGRLDSMTSARKIAARMSADPSVRRVVQAVVPVAGLLAETGATLTEAEFASVRAVAALDVPVAERLLLTVDRFVTTTPELDLSREARQALLDRFGLFGVRLATTMVRHGVVATAGELAAELLDRSGVADLRAVLESLFLERTDVLKSRSALLALESLTRARPRDGSDRIAVEAERIAAAAHAFRELRVLSAIRSGWVRGKEPVLADAERLVGGGGVQPRQRLALDAGADDDTVQEAALAALDRWQRRAESPMTDHQLAAASRVVIQSCEGMLADLHGWR